MVQKFKTFFNSTRPCCGVEVAGRTFDRKVEGSSPDKNIIGCLQEGHPDIKWLTVPSKSPAIQAPSHPQYWGIWTQNDKTNLRVMRKSTVPIINPVLPLQRQDENSAADKKIRRGIKTSVDFNKQAFKSNLDNCARILLILPTSSSKPNFDKCSK